MGWKGGIASERWERGELPPSLPALCTGRPRPATGLKPASGSARELQGSPQGKNREEAPAAGPALYSACRLARCSDAPSSTPPGGSGFARLAVTRRHRAALASCAARRGASAHPKNSRRLPAPTQLPTTGQ